MAAGSGEAPVVAFNSASSQHFNPTRPGTPVAKALQSGEVTGVTPATTYKVASNDSLWKIAKKFGIGSDDLAKANKLSPNASLKVGQKLIIPGKPAKTSASGAAGTRTYTVKSGDSLGTIARKQGASLADIRSLNPEIKNDVVRVGQELILPAAAPGASHSASAAAAPVVASAPVNAPSGSIEHIVSPGEGLGQIAKKYGVPQREIAVLNNIADPSSIRAGQKLVIPGVKTPSTTPAITLPAEPAPVAPITPSESPVAPAPAEVSPVAPSDAPAPPVVKVEESAPVSPAP
jgi:LysM repeat protein